jgi:hypothetical protein
MKACVRLINEHKHRNRLAEEKSPYLLQHEHNPADWFPWGDEAFEKAKKEDKSIFLSIGYSTCHWWQSPHYNQRKSKAFALLNVIEKSNSESHFIKIGFIPQIQIILILS